MSPAITAVQLEADAARAGSRQDAVIAGLIAEHRAHAAVRQRHNDVELAAACAAMRGRVIMALGVVVIDDVVVAAVAGEIEGAYAVGRKGDAAAA